MADYTPTPEAVEAACRAVHPTRWEYRTIAHPCEECTTAVTAAGPLIAAEAASGLTITDVAHLCPHGSVLCAPCDFIPDSWRVR